MQEGRDGRGGISTVHLSIQFHVSYLTWTSLRARAYVGAQIRPMRSYSFIHVTYASYMVRWPSKVLKPTGLHLYTCLTWKGQKWTQCGMSQSQIWASILGYRLSGGRFMWTQHIDIWGLCCCSCEDSYTVLVAQRTISPLLSPPHRTVY